MIKNKQGKGSGTNIIAVISVLAVLGLLGFIAFNVSQTAKPTETGEIIAKSVSCPDTKQTTATISVENKLNSTGSELYNTTLYLFSEGGEVVTLTNTAATTTTLTCGEEYTGKIISTNGASGDSSTIYSTSKGKLDAGNVVFETSGQALTLTLGS